jgi:mRNA interferase YafQ
MYRLTNTTQFERDAKKATKRGLDLKELYRCVKILADNKALPAKNRDHPLSNNWVGHREFHLKGDWIVVYRINEALRVLTLVRTGTHTDIFD